ncbi:MAG: glycosyltransferase family 4 protein [Bryobacteraceae bacterium]
MKIAFVITRADAVGGATIHVRDLAVALAALGHSPTVLVGGSGPVSRELDACGIRVISLRHLRRRLNPLRDALAVREMAGAIRRLQPDLVSAHTAKAGCVARLACSGMDVPVLYTPHGWAIGDRISARGGRFYRVVERAAAPLADAIVNVCHYERRLAAAHSIGRDAQHRVIYNGMPDIPGELRARPEADPPHIVMVARFEPPKDQETLLRALAGLCEFDWTCELVGDGPGLERAAALATQLGLRPRVRFVGSTPHVATALAGAQIFALATRSEAFPRSILEAMRAGLPVVASDVGGVSEAVEHGVTGLVAPRQSVTALEDALGELLTDREMRVRLGAAGRRAYERRFTFRRMLAQTVSLYEEVTGAAIPPALYEAREK